MKRIKTISIGDPHGLGTWKYVEEKEYDKIIFMGDYVDSFFLPDINIEQNLEDIIQFKKDNYEKVVLLLGNHDLQYMFDYKGFGCSGYRKGMYHVLNEIFYTNLDLFDVAFMINGVDEQRYLWTHAGVHSGWYYQRFLPSFKGTSIENLKLDEQLSVEFIGRNQTVFDVGHRRGGYQQVGGPFWADRTETIRKPLKHYHQIVGHTRSKKIIQHDVDLFTSITYVDCMKHDYNEDDFYKLNIYEDK